MDSDGKSRSQVFRRLSASSAEHRPAQFILARKNDRPQDDVRLRSPFHQLPTSKHTFSARDASSDYTSGLSSGRLPNANFRDADTTRPSDYMLNRVLPTAPNREGITKNQDPNLTPSQSSSFNARFNGMQKISNPSNQWELLQTRSASANNDGLSLSSVSRLVDPHLNMKKEADDRSSPLRHFDLPIPHEVARNGSEFSSASYDMPDQMCLPKKLRVSSIDFIPPSTSEAPVSTSLAHNSRSGSHSGPSSNALSGNDDLSALMIKGATDLRSAKVALEELVRTSPFPLYEQITRFRAED